MNSNYACISKLGGPAASTPSNNPLSYCLIDTVDSGFMHGGVADTIGGKHGKNCQAFMSSYCASNWNDVCEFASQDRAISYPNSLAKCGGGGVSCNSVMSSGDILVSNTASKKYLKEMSGGACSLKYEPFDPTVASSPIISFWQGSCNSQGNEGCVPTYEVDPSTIDKDSVMNKILARPYIAWGILVNIYNTAVRKKTINNLQGTKLYAFFQSSTFQEYIKITKGQSNLQCRSC